MNFLDPRLPDRFWAKCIPEPNSGCWLWLGANVLGYGRIGRRRGESPASTHRLAYESLVGPIPPGLDIDHLCRIPQCCNPAHLEPVTHSENLRRGTWAQERDRLHEAQRARTTCSRGHDLSGDNLFFTTDGNRRKRQCRECSRRRGRKNGAERVARHKALGLCWQCDTPAVAGKSECQRHLEISRVRDRTRRVAKRTARAA